MERGVTGHEGRGGDGCENAPALFKLLNTPRALLQGPALCLDSLLIFHARHERLATGKSKDVNLLFTINW